MVHSSCVSAVKYTDAHETASAFPMSWLWKICGYVNSVSPTACASSLAASGQHILGSWSRYGHVHSCCFVYLPSENAFKLCKVRLTSSVVIYFDGTAI